jgi:ankyrin repeat protein
MYAARQGSIDAARMLADMHAELDATDPDGTTALMVAIINAHFDLAHVLLEKGADPNIADINGTAALYWAVDMNTLGSMLSRPPPQWVDTLGAVDIVQELLARGANPNARLKRPIIGRHHSLVGDASLGEGTTPLARATKSNDLPVMRLLLDAGADPTLTLKDRTTVVMIAAAGGRQVGAYVGALPVTEASSLEAIKLCVERGVDVRAFNTSGETALHIAAARGADNIVRFLVEKGAGLGVKNKRGQTPLDAVANGGARGRGVGRGGVGRESSTAALLRELMAQRGIPVPPTRETTPSQ